MKDRASLYSYADGQKFKGLSTRETFQQIFETAHWNEISNDSVSGEGSSLKQAQELINQLPNILKNYHITSIFDLPCGDFNWMRSVNLKGITYIGGDLIEAIIRNNIEQFSAPNREFRVFNILEDKIPKTDLIFTRDLLVHFSFKQALKALRNIRKSDSKFFMATHFTSQQKNLDIITGGWRPLNMCKHPFNLPDPIFVLNEKCTEMDGIFSDKGMGFWKTDVLK